MGVFARFYHGITIHNESLRENFSHRSPTQFEKSHVNIACQTKCHQEFCKRMFTGNFPLFEHARIPGSESTCGASRSMPARIREYAPCPEAALFETGPLTSLSNQSAINQLVNLCLRGNFRRRVDRSRCRGIGLFTQPETPTGPLVGCMRMVGLEGLLDQSRGRFPAGRGQARSFPEILARARVATLPKRIPCHTV